ncbi:MAG: FKBP-type peptidyl-prolyl cis-trans isomerase [bacterium]|nr:FKBP-type peptidyl-prolyl cis-trans isomerase [bacterium]
MPKNTKIISGTVVAVLVIAVLYFVFDYRSKRGETSDAFGGKAKVAGDEKSKNTNPMDTQSFETAGFKIEILKEGKGVEAVSGNTVAVHYTGTLTNGQKFDSSIDRGQPFSFKLGAGQVIAGWDQGLIGMKVGEKRRLTIPPDLGYGAEGAGGVIPPNATLIFEVEILKID